ncbi:MAG: RuvABC resolvasome, subunit RuvA [Pseudomonadota bacterium]|jgi:Holliday junction DNA helicase RuvA
MIVGLIGKVIKKEPSKLHINVSGVVYEVFISLNTYQKISNDEQFLHICHIIREDAQQLFGFFEEDEKKLFENLIKINGVGGKVAIAICSTLSPSQFASAIATNDAGTLKKVPGVGPKMAARILIECGQFKVGDIVVGAASEAAQALETLGFKPEEIARALSGIESNDTATIVREALKKLQRF